MRKLIARFAASAVARDAYAAISHRAVIASDTNAARRAEDSAVFG